MSKETAEEEEGVRPSVYSFVHILNNEWLSVKADIDHSQNLSDKLNFGSYQWNKTSAFHETRIGNLSVFLKNASSFKK
jgi:hypothetical protein